MHHLLPQETCFPSPSMPSPTPYPASTHLALGLVLLGGPAHNEDLGGWQAQHTVDRDVLRGTISCTDFDEALKHKHIILSSSLCPTGSLWSPRVL